MARILAQPAHGPPVTVRLWELVTGASPRRAESSGMPGRSSAHGISAIAHGSLTDNNSQNRPILRTVAPIQPQADSDPPQVGRMEAELDQDRL